ncbi:YSIRK-type signal peptide-containing protein [Staphylococcus caprae]|uniref:YSIRK-targeted triacylglycerol lipase n=1 Tax=Staphylococcus TaxID=1279 RepID=UPI0008A980E4|nr:YSIRK-type signal peptide-containing protein [Staphylococcus sp. HMSC62A08]OHS42563.1 lipase [Staphylococcus sp. HMSC62A08]
METRKNKYSIRKFSVGTSSILIAALLFIGGNSAQAAEENHNQGTSDNEISQSIGTNNENVNEHQTTKNEETQSTSEQPNVKNDTNDKTNQQNSLHNENNQKDVHQNTDNEESATSQNQAQEQSTGNQGHQQSDSKEDVKQPSTTDDARTTGQTSTENTKEKTQNQNAKTEAEDATPLEKAEHHESADNQTQTPSKTENKSDNQVSESETQDKHQTKENAQNSKDEDAPTLTKENTDETKSSKDTDDTATVKSPKATSQQDNQPEADNHQKVTAQDDATSEATLAKTKDSDESKPLTVGDKANPTSNKDDSSDKDKDSKDGLGTLKNNAVATTNKKSKQQTTQQNKDQTNKKAKHSQYKNHDPIILVHGFNGFTDDINPTVLSHYWGGDKMNIRQDLEENGYEAYEASISAFSSNYDRAVELYYYIKGGRVDYGAAHAAKYGHKRYGKTYEGVYKDWKPGQKVHLLGHSMGGQTIRQLEELLRHGNPEEVEYQKEHGGTISPLYKGNNDNMVSSITTLASPHNGTHASDELGNEALVRQVVFDVGKAFGRKNSRVDFGLAQWGLKQKPNESYIDYAKRVQNSKLWKSQDNGFYDLTRDGATDLNRKTSLNPNIVYKTYTGESTHASLFGRQKADYNLFFPFTITANVIGKATEKEWRENDGLVSVISAQHPFNQKYVKATDKNQKGVWQVTPVKHDWDHVDFVGQDSSDTVRTREELQQFWHNLADDLVQSEQLTSN